MQRQNRRRYPKPRLHPARWEWWMNPYVAPSQQDRERRQVFFYTSRAMSREEREQLIDKADRYDALMQADNKQPIVRMTQREFDRLSEKIGLLDLIDREAIQKAIKRRKQMKHAKRT